jgi:hypothetical protein
MYSTRHGNDGIHTWDKLCINGDDGCFCQHNGPYQIFGGKPTINLQIQKEVVLNSFAG